MIVDNYPIPDNESERLNALHSYNILDSLPEEQYDAIVRLTSYICEVPLAFISFIDQDRQWFKAKFGMEIDALPRADAFCRYTLMEDHLVEVDDTTTNKRFADSAFVTAGPQFRFYASAPLIDPDGYRIGSLCVFDMKPRHLNDHQRDALKTLAAEVISHLVLRRQKKELEDSLNWYKDFFNLFNSSPEIHCITDKDLNIELINKAVIPILGYTPEEAHGNPIWKYFQNGKRAEILKLMRSDASKHSKSFEIETPIIKPDGELRWVSWEVTASGSKWYASGRDITQQRKDADQLELLSLVASKANNGIVISDSADHIVWTNDSFEAITGYKFEDVKNKELKDVLKGKLGENVSKEQFEETLKNRRSYEVDLFISRNDGKKIWISVINSVIRLENGQVDKQIRIISDITDRKRTEQDLEILSTASRKSPSGILIRDNQSRVVWMNEALEKIFGYTLSELKGKAFSDQLYGPNTDRQVLKDALKSVENNQPYEIEIQLYRKDGTPVWVFLSNSPYFNAGGDVERQIMVGVDITERKKNEEQLTYLSLVASNTLSGVVINDSEGKVEWVNNAFTKITGYTADDCAHKHLGDILKGELTDISIIEKSRELSKNKQSFEVDILAYRKDGQPIWLSIINSVIVGKGGEVEKYIEVIIDITAKKKIEIELISAREEALQLSKAKDMFISVMSHEIRTPLNAVIGMSHLLMEDNPSESQLENLDILKFSAENLLTLINDVLDYAKIDTGNIQLEKEKISLREIVHGVISSMHYKTGAHLYLKESVDEAVPNSVLGDKTRLTQILLNLVGNAVKFTEKGGVTVDLKVIEQSGKEVRIRFGITDTGIGIAHDKLGTIFESFKQAELDTTRKYGGTGLGLAITKRLIELHDSRINVDSVPGEGSTFWFTISFKKVEDATIKSNTNAELELNIHALVVDDNQINRLLINKVLKKWGASSDFAENGAEAVAMVEKNHTYNVVLMDVHMPVMGGLEATQAIRAKDDSYYKQLPIIALTASMLNNQMALITEAGMNDFVLKPFDPKVLYDKLSKYQKQ